MTPDTSLLGGPEDSAPSMGATRPHRGGAQTTAGSCFRDWRQCTPSPWPGGGKGRTWTPPSWGLSASPCPPGSSSWAGGGPLTSPRTCPPMQDCSLLEQRACTGPACPPRTCTCMQWGGRGAAEAESRQHRYFGFNNKGFRFSETDTGVMGGPGLGVRGTSSSPGGCRGGHREALPRGRGGMRLCPQDWGQGWLQGSAPTPDPSGASRSLGAAQDPLLGGGWELLVHMCVGETEAQVHIPPEMGL